MRALLLLLVSLPLAAEPLVSFTDDPPAIEVRALAAPPVLGVRYGAALDPVTLKVTLNGEVVTAAFTPEPGVSERVTLPFRPGLNRLEFEAWSVAAPGSEPLREFVQRDITYARQPSDAGAAERMKSLPELRAERWRGETAEAPAPAKEQEPPP